MEGTSEGSLSNEASFRDSSKVQFLEKSDRVENLVEKLMRPPVLTKGEIKNVYQRKECVASFV